LNQLCSKIQLQNSEPSLTHKQLPLETLLIGTAILLTTYISWGWRIWSFLLAH